MSCFASLPHCMLDPIITLLVFRCLDRDHFSGYDVVSENTGEFRLVLGFEQIVQRARRQLRKRFVCGGEHRSVDGKSLPNQWWILSSEYRLNNQKIKHPKNGKGMSTLSSTSRPHIAQLFPEWLAHWGCEKCVYLPIIYP
jgi:hypothetical protein